MDGSILQLLGLRATGYHTTRTTADTDARCTVKDAILTADKLDMVLLVAAAARKALAPALWQEFFHKGPADAQARNDDGDAGLNCKPLKRGRLGPGEVHNLDLQDGHETADANTNVEDGEPENEGQRHFVVAGHLQLPRSGDGQCPNGQLDRQTPCCNCGHDGDLCETGSWLVKVPVFGEGDATK